jgi:hypothetical protein
MMAAIIFVVSIVTLLMFFVSYCRSLTASSSRHVLSREVRDVTGITAATSEGDYARVMQLLQLCPDRPEDHARLQAVGFYYGMLSLVRETVAHISPSLRAWAESEQAACANFAAVTLDRRIAFSREVLSRQVDF